MRQFRIQPEYHVRIDFKTYIFLRLFSLTFYYDSNQRLQFSSFEDLIQEKTYVRLSGGRQVDGREEKTGDRRENEAL
jgi:hypothetical protein